MTYEQYWYGDVWMVVAYREADKRRKERKNAELHLMGMYFYEALCDVSPILHAFAKNGTKPIPYRTTPYELSAKKEPTEEEALNKEKNEKILARLYMRQMLRAGKNWGKNTD